MPRRGPGRYRRRNRCALPDCPQGDEVFPTLTAGMKHVWEAHGIRTPDDRQTAVLVPLDPRLPTTQRGHSKDYAPTPEQYARLLDVVQDDLDRLIFLVLGEAGLRRQELLHIRPSWLREGYLHVPYQDPMTGWKGKTPKAARTIPLRAMAPEAWDALESWFVGPRRFGRAPTPLGVCAATVYLRVRAGGVRARIPTKLFPHALRAYCATKWAYNFGNPFVLMDLMGWATPAMAIAYVRSTGRGLEDAVDLWNRSHHNGNNGHNGPNGWSMPSAGSPRLT